MHDRNLVFWLVIAVPLASLLMSATTMYFAFTSADKRAQVEEMPLSKTNWLEDQ